MQKKKYVIRGRCVWYDDETDYYNYNPLMIFAKFEQVKDFYYKNIDDVRWDDEKN